MPYSFRSFKPSFVQDLPPLPRHIDMGNPVFPQLSSSICGLIWAEFPRPTAANSILFCPAVAGSTSQNVVWSLKEHSKPSFQPVSMRFSQLSYNWKSKHMICFWSFFWLIWEVALVWHIFLDHPCSWLVTLEASWVWAIEVDGSSNASSRYDALVHFG